MYRKKPDIKMCAAAVSDQLSGARETQGRKTGERERGSKMGKVRACVCV